MRIWITGVGIVSPLGVGARATMRLLCEGQRAFDEVTLFSVEGQRTRIAAEVRDPRFARSDGTAGWSRTGAMALAAAREAIEESGLRSGVDEIDLVVGGTTGPMLETEGFLPNLADGEPLAVDVARMISHPLSMTTDYVRTAVGAMRNVRTISSACSTGANAILLGALWIASGRSKSVLVGAADALCRLTYTGFNALGSLDPAACRPFDRTRAGLSLGEGAAFLVIERDDVAAARGATPIAELAGWSAAAEAHHITNPEPDGSTAARVIKAALQVAGLSGSDLDYVNAHGTATQLNDAMELRALRSVLGNEMDRIAISSSKGQLGHSLGAAGAVEAAVCVLAIAQGVVPPTGGLTDPDAGCEGNHVMGTGRGMPVRAALTNSFGFGGLDSALAFCRPGFAPEKPAPSRRPARLASGAIISAAGQAGLLIAKRHAEPGPSPAEGRIELDPTVSLDPHKSRRLGRAERMLCLAVDSAIVGFENQGALDRANAGLVAGMASGSLDGVSRFLKKARDKGARFAPPADFPNLMLSAAAGHASIYHSLGGPVLSATDAGTSMMSAVWTAIDLVESSMADFVLAAGAAEATEAQFAATRAADPAGVHPLTEGASCVLIAPDASGSGARLLWRTQWHCQADQRTALAELPPPVDGARVVTAGDCTLAGTAWSGVDAVPIELRAGTYEGVDGAALVTAASLVMDGRCPVALAIACLGDRGCALLLGAP
ncbi:MAG: 3-oxoacyl-ACP synthase [Deltaproteobacteria bacterium]|nr:3-oxoacyl-ACP synthase [Deltaproteobacteria bacterium]